MDAVQAFLKPFGVQCVDVDTANVGAGGELSEHNDFASDHLWEVILNDIRAGQVKALRFGNLCTTFSKAREVRPGPPPLRDLDHPYGLLKISLTLQQHEQVRLGTFYALKAAEAASAAHSRGIPSAIGNPEPWEGHISMFLLPEFVTLASLPGVEAVNFDQCTVGAETAKPTRVLYFKVPLIARCGSGAATRSSGGSLMIGAASRSAGGEPTFLSPDEQGRMDPRPQQQRRYIRKSSTGLSPRRCL